MKKTILFFSFQKFQDIIIGLPVSCNYMHNAINKEKKNKTPKNVLVIINLNIIFKKSKVDL